jgi:hypothetical protein
LEDEKILPLMFLWEPYKPSLWFWEVIETTRRLMMTGVLSIIEPGSFSQLIAGLMMNIAYVVLLCLVRPYNETRDNSIAILTTLQLIFIFVASMSLKFSFQLTSSYDSEGLGLLMIACQVIIAVLFLGWAAWQKDDMGQSTEGIAARSLKSRTSVTNGDVELTAISVDRSDSFFEASNPMAKQVQEKTPEQPDKQDEE